MKRLNLKSFVKYLSMAMLGTVIAIGFINTPKMTVKAQTKPSDYCSYDSTEQKLTLTGIIVNEVDISDGGIVLPDGVNKTDVKTICSSSGAKLPVNSKYLFDGFTNLVAVSLADADTSEVTNMSYMFNNCASLEEAVLPINTKNVTQMNGMFQNCTKLESLDLSSFNFISLSDIVPTTGSIDECMQDMFNGCMNLECIIVGDELNLNSEIRGSNMFGSCYKLVGGKGTLFTNTKDGKSAKYAKIDSTDTHGYFSRSDDINLYAKLRTNGGRFVLEFYFSQKRTEDNKYVVTYNSEKVYEGGLKYNYDCATFEISVAAKNMNDAYPLIITRGDTEIYNKNISVADYLRRICQIYNTDDDYYKLAGSMLRYGAAAQKYFKCNTDKLANKGIDGYDTFEFNPTFGSEYNETTTSINADKIQEENALKNFTYSGISLSLDGEINFMMAFKLPSEAGITNWEQYTDKEAVETAIKKYISNDISTDFRNKTTFRLDGTGKYLLAVTPVNVKNIDSVIYTSDGFENDISAVTYLYRNYYRSASTDDLKNVCKSLYAFHQLAKDFNN